MNTPESAGESQTGLVLPGWLVVVMHIIITAGLPLVLVLLNARVLMSNAFLNWEYNRPNFPEDSYGFTKEDRLTHAPLALDYLFNDEGIEFLGDQTFPDGSSEHLRNVPDELSITFIDKQAQLSDQGVRYSKLGYGKSGDRELADTDDTDPKL